MNFQDILDFLNVIIALAIVIILFYYLPILLRHLLTGRTKPAPKPLDKGDKNL